MTESFENLAPRQMLEKAKYDLHKLSQDINIDNAFNFFVTAYHVIDHVRVLKTVPEDDINAFYEEPDFRKCMYICNKCKHRTLNESKRKRDDEFLTYQRPGAALGEFIIGESVLGLGRAYFIIDEAEQVDVLDLGKRIIDRWEAFSNTHSI